MKKLLAFAMVLSVGVCFAVGCAKDDKAKDKAKDKPAAGGNTAGGTATTPAATTPEKERQVVAAFHRSAS